MCFTSLHIYYICYERTTNILDFVLTNAMRKEKPLIFFVIFVSLIQAQYFVDSSRSKTKYGNK